MFQYKRGYNCYKILKLDNYLHEFRFNDIMLTYFDKILYKEWFFFEEEMQRLIDLRRDRNEEDFGTTFTGVQVQDKFKGMVKDCKVNIFFFKKKEWD